jgi:hypothetical protein
MMLAMSVPPGHIATDGEIAELFAHALTQTLEAFRSLRERQAAGALELPGGARHLVERPS